MISHGSGRLVTEATGIQENDPRWEPYRQQYLDWYEELLGSSAKPYEGLVDTLKAVHSAGKQWGVVTNKFRRFAEPLMQAMPFEPGAGVLVTPCDVTQAKPHPEPVLLAAAELKVAPEAMAYVGDHIRDIESGNAAGCFTIAVKYGYIEDHSTSIDLLTTSLEAKSFAFGAYLSINLSPLPLTKNPPSPLTPSVIKQPTP